MPWARVTYKVINRRTPIVDGYMAIYRLGDAAWSCRIRFLGGNEAIVSSLHPDDPEFPERFTCDEGRIPTVACMRVKG